MRLLKSIGTLVAVVMLAAVFTACGSDGATPPSAPVLATIVVSLSPTSLSVDQSAIATAAGIDQLGAPIALGVVTWSAADSSIARVSAGGFITGAAPGTTRVVATVAGILGSAPITVTAIPVATITVAPADARLDVGATRQLTATTIDAHGNALTGRPLAWTSSDPAKAIVNATGLVTGVANGTVAITATSEGRSGAAIINVGPEAVGTISVSPAATTIAVGTTAALTAVTTGLTGTVLTGRMITWTSSNAAVVAVTGSGTTATATAVAVGTVTIVAASEGVSASVAVTVVPPPAPCPAESALHLAVGELRSLTAAQMASVCIGGDAFASEYALIDFNASPFYEDVARLQFAAANTTAILGAAASVAVAKATDASQDGRAAIIRGEIAFKNRERAQLASRLAAVRGRAGAAGVIGRRQSPSVPTAPVVGATYTLNANVADACGPKELHPARVVAVLPHTIVFVDAGAPAGGYTDAELMAFGAAFDTIGFAIDTLNFGAPTDIDGNGRLGIFFTPGVNQLPIIPGTLVAGLFTTRDLLLTTGAGACAGSNEGEMFYMPVPDPTKSVNGAYADKAFLSNTVAGVLVHEMQHLINAGRRLYVNGAAAGETVWLNEGLSHIAEELLYYRMSGNAPRANIGGALIRSTAAQLAAYHAYMADGNIQRLGTYLESPEFNSPYSDFDGLQTRGAIWELLRYAADRKGGAERNTWRALVNSTTQGQTNFTQVFGSITDIARDWAVAQFADDAGLGVAAPFTYPSWNFRSVFLTDDNYGVWPLATRSLSAGSTSITLVGGGAAYFRFRVGAGVLASVVTTAIGGAPAPPFVAGTLLRTR